MSFRALCCIFFAGLLAVIAMSTDGRMYLLVALLLAMMFILAAVSAFIAYLTLDVSVMITGEDIQRGESRTLKITIKHNGPLPIAPIKAAILSPAFGEDEVEHIRIPARSFIKRTATLRIHCPHVGVFSMGVARLDVEDVFGLFSLSRTKPEWCASALVLPRIERLSCPPFSMGESEVETISRATEDATSPSGVRKYQTGDELKKIHWKLSLRKREILVKTFDQPLRPDAVVLLDCAAIGQPPLTMDTRDCLSDLAASACAFLLEADAVVRMPLTGSIPEDVVMRRGDPLPPMLRAIARMRFGGTTTFERILALESMNMRQSGTTIILTRTLSHESADRVIRLRRLGPTVRVYLVTDKTDELQHGLIARLSQNDVECVIRSTHGDFRREAW